MSLEIRVGQGFDVHRAGDDPHRPLVLGGCRFPGVPGLVGHSDGDAVAHAVTEALLGAAGLGDIGEHFPDTDERFRGADAAVPAVPVTDTVKVVDAAGTVVATPDRATLVAVQTPQAFRAGALRAAHAAGGDGTDDAALVEAAGGLVVTVPGEPWNHKITSPDDLDRTRDWLARRQTASS